MHEYVAVARTLLPILERGRSLDTSWDKEASPLAKQICYGVLRNYFRLDRIVSKLVRKPFRGKNRDIHILLLAGIYSIDHIKRPAYTSVNDVVEAADRIGKPWAKGVVNGVLRNYIRGSTALGRAVDDSEVARYNHPAWMIDALRSAWPDDWQAILSANNEQAPMTLRVNVARTTVPDYLARLRAAGIEASAGTLSDCSIYLGAPVQTAALPLFNEGYVSVQDEASQLAAPLMTLTPGLEVLDACAAPGGKTCHLLECEPDIALTAIDVDADRTRLIRQNLDRLGGDTRHVRVITADLIEYSSTTKAPRFDRILLDAPCSATGTIRRHPDIKLLRRKSDIDKLVGAQLELLRAAWKMLQNGGVIVYSTCSILPAENEGVVSRFITEAGDATPMPIEATWGTGTAHGRQLLPASYGHDGFYYSRLTKGRGKDPTGHNKTGMNKQAKP